MHSYRRNALEILFFILILFTIAGSAENEIVFYSLSAPQARTDYKYALPFSPVNRQYIPLMGTWGVLSADGTTPLGKVNAPFSYLNNQTFVFIKTLSGLKKGTHHYTLYFEGINGVAEVILNNHTIFNGSRNFLPIEIPLSEDILKDSTNVLSVKLSPWNGQGLHLPQWFPDNLPRIDTGIRGAAFLEIAPPTFISGISAGLDSLTQPTTIAGKINIESLSPLAGHYTVNLQVIRDDQPIGNIQLPYSADSTVNSVQLPFAYSNSALVPWTPENPIRYRIRCTLYREGNILDGYGQPVSIKTITASGNQIQLNDSTVAVNGINYVYEDMSGTSVPNRKLMREDLQKIKERGFNAVRIGFYPMPPFFYRLTDSLGLMCFQDLPILVPGKSTLSDTALTRQFKSYLGNFMETAKQHSSLSGVGIALFFNPSDLPEFDLNKLYESYKTANQLFYVDSQFPEMLHQQDSTPVFFEILKRNHPEESLEWVTQNIEGRSPVLLSGLSKAISYQIDSTAVTEDIEQIKRLYILSLNPAFTKPVSGNFILTYSDYFLQTPSMQSGPQGRYYLSKTGIFTLERVLKPNSEILFTRKKHLYQNHFTVQEKRNIGTFIFVILGLINFLVFLVIYRTLIEFRQNISRAVRRPHGFFMDLQERRLISFGQSLYLILVMSINGAVIMEGILYYFRNNLFMDFLLSLFTHGVHLKLQISYLIWHPVLAVPVFSILFALIFILLAAPIRIFSIFQEHRIRTRQALAISAWSGAHFLLLLPFGMFFYNLIVVLNSYWILFFVLLYFHAWYYLRWIKGTRVILGLSYTRVFLLSIALLGLGGIAVFYFLQARVNFSELSRYIVQLYSSLNL